MPLPATGPSLPEVLALLEEGLGRQRVPTAFWDPVFGQRTACDVRLALTRLMVRVPFHRTGTQLNDPTDPREPRDALNALRAYSARLADLFANVPPQHAVEHAASLAWTHHDWELAVHEPAAPGLSRVLAADLRARSGVHLRFLVSTPDFERALDERLSTTLLGEMMTPLSAPALVAAVTSSIEGLPRADRYLALVDMNRVERSASPPSGAPLLAPLVLASSPAPGPGAAVVSSLRLELLARAGVATDAIELEPHDTLSVVETALVIHASGASSLASSLDAARAIEG